MTTNPPPNESPGGQTSLRRAQFGNDGIDVVTMGETMVLLSAQTSGRLRHVDTFRRSCGGAESNFAIALARLGVRVGWLSRLGDDEFGAYIEGFLRGEGVEVSAVRLDPRRATGVFFKEQTRGSSTPVVYYRDQTAASALSPDDIDAAYLTQANHLHVTGITLALSDSARAAVDTALDIARNAGCTVSLDANVRHSMWDAERWRTELWSRVPLADTVFVSRGEEKLLTGTDDPAAAAEILLAKGPSLVIVKQGAAGALVATAEEKFTHPAVPMHPVVQPHGAGDAYAAGVIAGQRWGWSLDKCAHLGALLGAYATTVTGNVEGLPIREEALNALEGYRQACR